MKQKCPACLSHGWRIFTSLEGSRVQRCDDCQKFDQPESIANARGIGLPCDDLGYITIGDFTENQVFLITPFMRNPAEGIWVFNDPLRGLMEEPFVGDINSMIDHMVLEIHDPHLGFHLYFSAQPMRNNHVHLNRVENEDESGMGATYFCEELNVNGWLCPALLRYFKSPPDHLYGWASPIHANNKGQRKGIIKSSSKSVNMFQFTHTTHHI